MFNQEMFGYSKEEVDQYLVETLKRLESFEHTIDHQRGEIKSLEKKIEVLKVSGGGENILEKTKKEADEIIINTLIDANQLQNRIREVIKQELEK